MSKNRQETSKISENDQNFKKPGKNRRKYLKTVKNVKKTSLKPSKIPKKLQIC